MLSNLLKKAKAKPNGSGQDSTAPAYRAGQGPSMDSSQVEGFLCPTCMIKFGTAEALTHHFVAAHASDDSGSRSEATMASPTATVVGADTPMGTQSAASAANSEANLMFDRTLGHQSKVENVTDLVKTLRRLQQENAELSKKLSAKSAVSTNDSHVSEEIFLLEQQLLASNESKALMAQQLAQVEKEAAQASLTLVEDFGLKEHALLQTIEQMKAELRDLRELNHHSNATDSNGLANFADIEIPPDLTSDFFKSGVKLDGRSQFRAPSLPELDQGNEAATEPANIADLGGALAEKDQTIESLKTELLAKSQSLNEALASLTTEKAAVEKMKEECTSISSRRDQELDQLKVDFQSRLEKDQEFESVKTDLLQKLETAEQALNNVTADKRSMDQTIAEDRQRSQQAIESLKTELNLQSESAAQALKKLTAEKEATERKLAEVALMRDNTIESLKAAFQTKLDAADHALKRLTVEKQEVEKKAEEEIQRKKQ